MPRISVVVPVYNVEKYLDVCLDSILCQSFKDFEIICIDDGSTDSSGDIIERYSQFDNRIRTYHRENSGLAATRNFGLEYALSPYVMFVDSDDWLSPVILERLYNNIRTINGDYTSCGIYQCDSVSGTAQKWDLLPPNVFQQIVKRPFFNEREVPPWFMFRQHVMAWAKLYRKDFIETFRFPEGKIFEDNPFFTRCYLTADRIGYDFAPLYYYRVNRPNSIVAANTNKYKDVFDIFHLTKQVFEECGKYEKYKTDFVMYYMQVIMYRTVNTDDANREEMFNLLKQTFGEINYEEYNMVMLSKNPIFGTIKECLDMSYEEFNNKYVRKQAQDEQKS